MLYIPVEYYQLNPRCFLSGQCKLNKELGNLTTYGQKLVHWDLLGLPKIVRTSESKISIVFHRLYFSIQRMFPWGFPIPWCTGKISQDAIGCTLPYSTAHYPSHPIPAMPSRNDQTGGTSKEGCLSPIPAETHCSCVCPRNVLELFSLRRWLLWN